MLVAFPFDKGIVQRGFLRYNPGDRPLRIAIKPRLAFASFLTINIPQMAARMDILWSFPENLPVTQSVTIYYGTLILSGQQHVTHSVVSTHLVSWRPLQLHVLITNSIGLQDHEDSRLMAYTAESRTVLRRYKGLRGRLRSTYSISTSTSAGTHGSQDPRQA